MQLNSQTSEAILFMARWLANWVLNSHNKNLSYSFRKVTQCINEVCHVVGKDLYSCIFNIIRLGTKHKKTYWMTHTQFTGKGSDKELSNYRYISLKGPLYDLQQRCDNHLIKTVLWYLDHIAPSGVISPINTDSLLGAVEYRSLSNVYSTFCAT